ncbi:TonB-dependent receptor [Novosphingobium colocasiae]
MTNLATLRSLPSPSLVALALSLSLAVVNPAFAQDTASETASTSSESEGIGDIVVTAQRREQNLQQVPISITAVSGDKLRDLGLTRSTDIIRLTPGVSISSSSGGENAQYSMRGVTQNDYAEIAEGPIAVYVDDSYIPNLQGQNFGFYDMQRVEVLKGPQGILFGRNATGGLVHYIINKPSDRLEGYGQATYGSYDQVRLEGAVGGPISDTLSARVSFLYDRNGAFWKNQAASDIASGAGSSTVEPCCADLGGKRNIAGRLQLEYKPTNDLSIRLMGSINRQRYSTAAYAERPSVAVTNADGVIVDTVFTDKDALGYTPPDIGDREISSDLAKKKTSISPIATTSTCTSITTWAVPSWSRSPATAGSGKKDAIRRRCLADQLPELRQQGPCHQLVGGTAPAGLYRQPRLVHRHLSAGHQVEFQRRPRRSDRLALR